MILPQSCPALCKIGIANVLWAGTGWRLKRQRRCSASACFSPGRGSAQAKGTGTQWSPCPVEWC